MSKSEKEKIKAVQEKCVAVISQLLREEDNKYCVDCDAKGPRWASWNLGIFLCIRCAGIHRNLGVHISRVKSVNLDTWTPEQVGSLQQMGNSKGRAVYEANLPDNFRRPSSDSSLEVFIRAKYEHKKYIAKEWVPAPVKPAFSTDELGRKKDDRRKNKSGSPTSKSPASVARPKAVVTATTPATTPSAPTPEHVKTKTESNQDLLGLDMNNSSNSAASGDDMFGLFTNATSATPSVQPQQQPVNGASVQSTPNQNTTSDDFFNQKSEASSDGSKKMSNESILSLFSANQSNPSMAQPQVQSMATNQQMFGMPGGMYVGGFQNGLQMHPQQQQQPAQCIANGMMMPQQQPFMNQSPVNFQQQQQQYQQQQMAAPVTNNMQQNVVHANPSSDLIGWNSNTNQPAFMSNQMQHQMAAMQISAPQGWNMAPQMNQQTMNMQQGQTLSNNLWK